MIDVLVVANVRLFREGLAQALGTSGRVRVVGTARAGDTAAFRGLGVAQPAIVLIEITSVDAAATVATIRRWRPETKVVALGIGDDVHDVVACVEAGIDGYATSEASLDELIETLESVARDEMPCSPRVAASLMKRLAALIAEQEAARSQPGDLTRRELEVIALIDEGLSNKEIARRLHIELATVKNHVHRILEKLHVSRRLEAAALIRGRSAEVELPFRSGSEVRPEV